MVTLVCCYNDRKMLGDMLLASLAKQTAKHNVVLIDASEHGFTGAAQAYNAFLDNPGEFNAEISDYLIFTHQDIAFIDNDLLEKVEALLQKSPNDIFGFAGMTSSGVVKSNLRYQSDDKYIVRTQLDSAEQVESLDECCFAMTRELWSKVRFDDKTCDAWHLYAVDFCYNAKRLQDSRSYALPLAVYHKFDSAGGLGVDRVFLRTLRKMMAKYRKNTARIFAPCYIIDTSFVRGNIRLLRSYLKLMLA